MFNQGYKKNSQMVDESFKFRTIESFDLQFDLYLFLQAATVIDYKINNVIYFSQSQLLLAKTNKDRTKSRKALYIHRYVCIYIYSDID